MPLLSLVAAVFGGVLIGWRWIGGLCNDLFRFVLRRPAPVVQDTDSLSESSEIQIDGTPERTEEFSGTANSS